MIDLPPYVLLDGPDQMRAQVLKTEAHSLSFPLSPEDQKDIQTLVDKYDQEASCVGLAAPQIGISKQFIFVNVPNDPNLKKWRPDLTDTMERTLMINPKYEPLVEEKEVAYEGCFSVGKVTGQVPRYKSIRYVACSPEGIEIKGEATGFLARVLQHEIDHVHGKCFVDVVVGELIPMEKYLEMRREKMGK